MEQGDKSMTGLGENEVGSPDTVKEAPRGRTERLGARCTQPARSRCMHDPVWHATDHTTPTHHRVDEPDDAGGSNVSKPEDTGGEPSGAGGEDDLLAQFGLTPEEWKDWFPDGLLDTVRRSRAWRGSLPLHPAPV